jgi:hypothetical protein
MSELRQVCNTNETKADNKSLNESGDIIPTSKFLSLKPYRDSFDEVLGEFLNSPKFMTKMLLSRFHGSWNDSYYTKRYDIEGLATGIESDGERIYFVKTVKALKNRKSEYDCMGVCIHALEVGIRHHHLDIFHKQGSPRNSSVLLKQNVTNVFGALTENISTYFSDRCKLEGIKMDVDNDSDDCRTIITFEIDRDAKGHNKSIEVLQSHELPELSESLGQNFQPASPHTDKLIDKLRSNYASACKDRNIKLEESFQKIIVEKLIDASTRCRTFVSIPLKELYLYDENSEWYKDRCLTENIHIVRCGGCDKKYYVNITYQCNGCGDFSCGEEVKVYFDTQ